MSTNNRIGFFDLKSGVSGDMLLSSFCHHAVPIEYLKREITKIPFPTTTPKVELDFQNKKKNGIVGLNFKVLNVESNLHRTLKDIIKLINDSSLNENIKNLSLKIFKELGKAEATVHGVDIEQIHFHEVGAIDSIVDIIGSAICVDYLKLDELIATPINTGFGTVKCDHGTLPIPAPATAELLNNIPSYSSETEGELATPTGVAIIKTIATKFQHNHPPMNFISTGHGIGTKNYENTFPLRFILGKKSLNHFSTDHNTENDVTVIETNIDDCSPEIMAFVAEKILSIGALDVCIIPTVMKKGRAGNILQVITKDHLLDVISDTILTETTSFGLRYYSVSRLIMNRGFEKLETPFGLIDTKTTIKKDRKYYYPEYESCKKVALEKQIPIYEIYGHIQTLNVSENLNK